jgi:hypothetical protein
VRVLVAACVCLCVIVKHGMQPSWWYAYTRTNQPLGGGHPSREIDRDRLPHLLTHKHEPNGKGKRSPGRTKSTA